MRQSSLDELLRKFLDDLAARQPTPGGGSASALAGALGAALGSMAALYTTGNDKFAAVEPRARELDAALAALRARFAALVDRDIAAYETYAAARKLPKNTPQEKAARGAAVARAREQATAVPEEIIQAALEGFRVLEELLPIANPNLAGDLSTAAYFLETAARGAAIQVMANCAAPDADGSHARRRAAAGENVARGQQARERVDAAVLKMMQL